MRIAIDLDKIGGEKTGIDYYTEDLIENLAKIDRKNEYYFLRSRSAKIENNFIPKQKNFSFKLKRIPKRVVRFLFDKIHIPIESFFGPIDILHNTDHIPPPVKNAKLIITIHDLSFLLFPEHIIKSYQMYVKSHILAASERADRIITVSNNSKKDIVRLLNAPPQKINVVYEAAKEIFRPIRDTKLLQGVREKYRLNQKFILYVGTLEPRKNIPTLIKAFHLLKKYRGVKHKLVIAGKKGWLYEDIFRTVEELNLKDEVIFTGYVPREDLPALYNSADLFVYPSFYEGFGLPPVEAMSCGVPVITSNTSCFPEVIGEAGMLIEPRDERALSEAMYRVLTDSAFGQQLTEKGLKRANSFSWRRAAQETLKIYEDVYQKIGY